MLFMVEADSPAEAWHIVPDGFLRSATAVTEVDKAYKFAPEGM